MSFKTAENRAPSATKKPYDCTIMRLFTGFIQEQCVLTPYQETIEFCGEKTYFQFLLGSKNGGIKTNFGRIIIHGRI